jgi:hypothetical protein
MNSKQITDILLAIQASITLLISVRAFYLYSRTRSDALFAIGLSMGVIGLGGICGLRGHRATDPQTQNEKPQRHSPAIPQASK